MISFPRMRNEMGEYAGWRMGVELGARLHVSWTMPVTDSASRGEDKSKVRDSVD